MTNRAHPGVSVTAETHAKLAEMSARTGVPIAHIVEVLVLRAIEADIPPRLVRALAVLSRVEVAS